MPAGRGWRPVQGDARATSTAEVPSAKALGVLDSLSRYAGEGATGHRARYPFGLKCPNGSAPPAFTSPSEKLV